AVLGAAAPGRCGPRSGDGTEPAHIRGVAIYGSAGVRSSGSGSRLPGCGGRFQVIRTGDGKRAAAAGVHGMGKQISLSGSRPRSVGVGRSIVSGAAAALALGYAFPGLAASRIAELATPPGITLQLVGRGQGYGRQSFF